METAAELFANFSKENDPDRAHEVLRRLVVDARMKRVWAEIYRKKRHRSTEEFLHEADTASLEALGRSLEPKWTNQDRAAQALLSQAFRTALDEEPVLRSNATAKMKDLRNAASLVRSIAARLQSHGLNDRAFDLAAIADHLDDEGEGNVAAGYFRGTRDARVRSFVLSFSWKTFWLFGDALYGTVGNVTNAVFNRSDMTGIKVREMLRNTCSHLPWWRHRAGKNRGGMGPWKAELTLIREWRRANSAETTTQSQKKPSPERHAH